MGVWAEWLVPLLVGLLLSGCLLLPSCGSAADIEFVEDGSEDSFPFAVTIWGEDADTLNILVVGFGGGWDARTNDGATTGTAVGFRAPIDVSSDTDTLTIYANGSDGTYSKTIAKEDI